MFKQIEIIVQAKNYPCLPEKKGAFQRSTNFSNPILAMMQPPLRLRLDARTSV